MGRDEPQPEVWTCNACGEVGDTSDEHLVHVAIGRVILGDAGLSRPHARMALRSPPYSEYARYAGPSLEEHLVHGLRRQWSFREDGPPTHVSTIW